MLSPEDPAGTPRSEAAAASRAATLAHHRTRRYGDISRPPHVEPVAYPRGWFLYCLTAEFSKKILSFRILEGGCVPSVLHHYKMS
jgi:hypothetical protein